MPKIQIGPDRNIYPSENPDYQYQANAGGLSVWFNRKKGQGWDHGLWVHANPDSEYWWILAERTKTNLWFPFPKATTVTVEADRITYDYGNWEIRVQVGHWSVHPVHVVKNSQGLNEIAKECRPTLNKMSAILRSPKQLDLQDDDGKGLSLWVGKMWDSAQNPIFPPCQMGEGSHLCGKASELNCQGCPVLPCSACPKENKIQYRPAESDAEQIKWQNNKIVIEPDLAWLQDPARVFPIYIGSPEITGWQAGANITLAGKFAEANASSTLYDSTTTANSGVGLDCAGAEVGLSYGTNYIILDLGASYSVDQIKVFANMADGGGNGQGADVQVQYKTNGSYSPFGGTDELNTKGVCSCNTAGTLDFASITAQTTTHVRIEVKATTGVSSLYRCYINEIEVYGTEAGGAVFELLVGAGGMNGGFLGGSLNPMTG